GILVVMARPRGRDPMMKRTKRVQCKSLLALLLATLAAAATQIQASDLSARAAAIDRAAQEAIAARETPGLQVAVFKNGAPVLVKAYGMANLELNVPMTNDSVVRIG